MKKFYISLPVTGRDMNEVRAEAELAKEGIREAGHEPVSPLDQDTERPYAEVMGNDIRMLLECDGVVFLPGWLTSRGCRLEHDAALIYGLERTYGTEELA